MVSSFSYAENKYHYQTESIYRLIWGFAVFITKIPFLYDSSYGLQDDIISYHILTSNVQISMYICPVKSDKGFKGSLIYNIQWSFLWATEAQVSLREPEPPLPAYKIKTFFTWHGSKYWNGKQLIVICQYFVSNLFYD